MILLLGTIAFGLYFLYDLNSVLWNNRVLHYSFFTGTALLCGTTILMVWRCEDTLALPRVWGYLFGILAIVFLILLIYTLFFALPFEKTYIDANEKRLAYSEGVYALCRHPGVLWFIGFYLCLALYKSSDQLLIFGGVFSLWNILYILFQDIYTFPRTFSNYHEYKKTTPFLIPNAGSFRRCVKTLRHTKE